MSVLQLSWLWRILRSMRKPHPPKPPSEPDWPYDIARELGHIATALHQMRIEMSALTDQIAATNQSFTDLDASVQALIAKVGTGTPDPEVAVATQALSDLKSNLDTLKGQVDTAPTPPAA